MDAIFSFIPKGGKPFWNNTEDFWKFCIENEGEDIYGTFKVSSKLSEKQKMYNYLFGPLMKCAMDAFTDAGYEGMDKVKARYKLEAEFLKIESYNSKTGKTEVYTESVAGLNKKRLLKFIVDVVFHLEMQYRSTCPDSVEWKMKQETGRNYDRVK